MSQGRYKAAIWAEFTPIAWGTNGKAVTQKCNMCHASVSSKVERLQQHKLKCKKEIHKEVSKRAADSVDEESSEMSSQVSTQASGSTPKPPQKKQSRIDVFKTTEDKKQEIAEQWSRFFYSSRLPFAACENPEFKKALEITRPGLGDLLSRKELAGKYLDIQYTAIEKESKVCLVLISISIHLLYKQNKIKKC